MKNYEVKFSSIKSYELICVKCLKWNLLSDEILKELESRKDDTGFTFKPSITVKCKHCESQLIVPTIGKYDKPNISRNRCHVQCVTITESSYQKVS